MGEKTEVVEKVWYKEYMIPLKGIVVGVLGMILAAIINTIIGPVSGFGPTGETSLMTIAIIAIITSFSKKLRLSLEDYVVVFTMTYAAPVSDGAAETWFAFPLKIHSDALGWLNKIKSDTALPSWYYGPKEAFDLALEGGVAPPWGLLIPWCITGLGIALLTAFMVMFAAAPFRRQIIEIERLPFPVATGTYSLILNVYAEGEEAKSPVLGTRRNWAILGFIVGFILTAVTQGYVITQVAPDIVIIPGMWDISHDVWKSVPGMLIALQFNSFFPWSWFGFFFPMESLIGIALGALLTYLVIVPWEISAGLIPSFDMSFSSDDLWFYAFRVEGLKFFFAGVAMINGAVIAHYITGLKANIENWKKNPEDAFGKWRTTVYLAIIAILIYVGFGAAAGGWIPVVFVSALDLLFLANLFWIRGIAEANLMFGSWAVYFMDTLQTIEAFGFAQRGVGKVTPGLIGTYAPQMILLYSCNMAGVAYMESSRFAFLSKVSPKKVVSSLILGIIIAYFIQWYIHVSLNYQFGITSSPYGSFGAGDWILYYPYRFIYQTSVINRWYSLDPTSMPFYWLCFILGIGLTIGRMYFAIPFSPIGFAFGMMLDPWSFGYTFIPFLILKWIFLKIGGGRLYERVGVPFFAGGAGGAMFAAFVAGVLQYWKYATGG